MGSIASRNGLERPVIHKYHHRDIYCSQRDDWDCGLACVGMVLKWSKHTVAGELVLDDQHFWERKLPLWTIEMYIMLSKYNGMEIELFTSYVGVQDNYRNSPWYSRTFEGDKRLIEDQFSYAMNKGMKICQVELSSRKLAEILMQFESNCVIITLVDNSILLQLDDNACFLGHFILLVGFDDSSSTFLCLNPGINSSEVQYIEFSTLDKARYREGTDCDTIVCMIKSRY